MKILSQVLKDEAVNWKTRVLLGVWVDKKSCAVIWIAIKRVGYPNVKKGQKYDKNQNTAQLFLICLLMLLAS